MVIILTKPCRSVIFFLSVTALICFVLDHLLCPAHGACVVTKDREHCRQIIELGCWIDVTDCVVLSNELKHWRAAMVD